MSEEAAKPSFLDKFAEISGRIGSEVHLRSLRDAFATIMPLYILAGIAVLKGVVPAPTVDGTPVVVAPAFGTLVDGAGDPRQVIAYKGHAVGGVLYAALLISLSAVFFYADAVLGYKPLQVWIIACHGGCEVVNALGIDFPST